MYEVLCIFVTAEKFCIMYTFHYECFPLACMSSSSNNAGAVNAGWLFGAYKTIFLWTILNHLDTKTVLNASPYIYPKEKMRN